MEQLFNELIDLFTREIAAYKQLLELAREERDAINKNLIPELDSIVANQSAALKTLNKLEDERKQFFRIFSQGSGIQAPTVPDLINNAKGELRVTLKEKSAELERTAAALRKENDVNRRLLEEQARYVSFCVNLFSESSNSMDTYSNSGRLSNEGTAQYRLLDQSI